MSVATGALHRRLGFGTSQAMGRLGFPTVGALDRVETFRTNGSDWILENGGEREMARTVEIMEESYAERGQRAGQVFTSG
jgi:hypothetical protein